jgi:hypothetical protein
MSDLPREVSEAGLLFRNPILHGDQESLQRIIDWGREQIDREYPIDHFRAPLNSYRRMRAHQEWDTVIRTAGASLRGEIASMAVRELQFEIERRRQEILAQDAERRRRESLRFDTDLQKEVFEDRSSIDLNNQITLLERQHTLAEQAADNASHRLLIERSHETEQQLTTMLTEAAVKAMGTSSAAQVLDAIKTVNAEVLRVRNDPTMSDDDKHLQIKNLLDTLPIVLQAARSRDG